MLEKNIQAQGRWRFIEICLILLMLLGSIIMRWPAVARPLSGHHEWLTGHTLVVHKIWHEQGIWEAKFCQKMSFNRPSDKFINNAAMSNPYDGYPHDQEGNYYYMSYPPLGVIVPYLVFQLLGMEPEVLPLRLFNLMLHGLCALMLTMLLRSVMPLPPNRVHWPAVTAAALYIFLPAPLWYHSNVYYVEIFAQLMFILSVLMAVLFFQCDRSDYKRRRLLWCALWLSLFLVTYTEWIGGLVAGFISLTALVKYRNFKEFFIMVLVAGSAVLAALGLFIFQHHLVIGFDGMVANLLEQFVYRAGSADQNIEYSNVSITEILNHYYLGVTPLLLLFIGMAVTGMMSLPKKYFWRQYGIALSLTFLPALTHHIVLSNYTTIHDFSIMKSIFFLILFPMIFAYECYRTGGFASVFKILLFAVMLGGFVHYSYNRYRKNYAYTPISYDHFYHLGNDINKNINGDEVIFLIKEYKVVSPELLYYTGKNVQPVSNRKEADEFLKKHGGKQGVLFVQNRGHMTFKGLISGEAR